MLILTGFFGELKNKIYLIIDMEIFYNIKDHLRWEEWLEHNSDKSNDQLLEIICTLKEPSFAYFFAYFFNYRNDILQKIVLRYKNARYCFLFAKKREMGIMVAVR
jgi:hypothetical protein